MLRNLNLRVACLHLQEAFQQNEQKRRAESADSVLQRMQQDKQRKGSPAKIQELTPAEAEKESGNAAFKKGAYEDVSHKLIHARVYRAIILSSMRSHARRHSF